MECFAGFLSHADEQIGRVLSFVEALEESTTLVMLVSDNGASSEGGVRGSINDARLWNGLPAGRTELRARIDEFGDGVGAQQLPVGLDDGRQHAVPAVEARGARGRHRRPVHRVVAGAGGRGRGALAVHARHRRDADRARAGGRRGTRRLLEGTSFAYLLSGDGAGAAERHTTQYFEMLGSRGIYHEGWKAVTFKPMAAMYDDGLDPDAPFEDDVWELYHVASDLSECVDLAAAEPARLAALVELWWAEARKYQVLPLDNRPLAALLAPRRLVPDRPHHTFWPGGALVPETMAPNLRNRSHSIIATLDSVGDGVLLAMGTTLGGWSFQVFEGRLRYVHNYLGRASRDVLTAPAVLAPGPHEVAFEFETAGDFRGVGRLLVDWEVVGSGEIPRVTPVRYSITGGGMTCGWEQGPAVGTDYSAPFPYSGSLRCVVVNVGGTPYRDPHAEFEAIMAEQ